MAARRVQASARAALRGDDLEGDIDIAARGFRVRADGIGVMRDCRGDFGVQAGHTQGKAGLQQVLGAGQTQIHFNIHSRVRRQGHFHLLGGNADGGDIASRPGTGEQLFSGRMRLDGRELIGGRSAVARGGQLDVDVAFVVARNDAGVAGSGMGFASEKDFCDLGHCRLRFGSFQ